jgi:hypothetical protein
VEASTTDTNRIQLGIATILLILLQQQLHQNPVWLLFFVIILPLSLKKSLQN